MYGQVCFPNLYKWTFNCLHQKRQVEAIGSNSNRKSGNKNRRL